MTSVILALLLTQVVIGQRSAVLSPGPRQRANTTLVNVYVDLVVFTRIASTS